MPNRFLGLFPLRFTASTILKVNWSILVNSVFHSSVLWRKNCVQFLLIWRETVAKQRYTPNKGPSDRLNSDPLYSLRNPNMQSEVMQLPVNGGSTKPKSLSSPHQSAGGNLDEEIISFCYWHDNQGPIRRWAHLSSLLDQIAGIHVLKTRQELYWHRSHQPLSHWVVISCLAIAHSFRDHEEGSVPGSCLCL